MVSPIISSRGKTPSEVMVASGSNSNSESESEVDSVEGASLAKRDSRRRRNSGSARQTLARKEARCCVDKCEAAAKRASATWFGSLIESEAEDGVTKTSV